MSASHCPACGAVIANRDLHRRWHERLGYPAEADTQTGDNTLTAWPGADFAQADDATSSPPAS